MKKNWNEITLNDYKRIVEISEREFDSELEKQIGYLSVIMDVDEDELWNKEVLELGKLLDNIKWLEKDFTFNKTPFKSLKINGEKYDVKVDITKFSVAQYADFQIYWEKRNNPDYMGKLMTLFIIPSGKKYNDGYDVLQLADVIENNLSICDYNSICFFFLQDLMLLLKALTLYSSWIIKKNLKKNPKMEEQYKKLQTLTKHLI